MGDLFVWPHARLGYGYRYVEEVTMAGGQPLVNRAKAP